MQHGTKVAIGVGAAIVAGVGGVIGYDAWRARQDTTVTGTGNPPASGGSSSSGGSSTTGSSMPPTLGIGQPFLTGAVGRAPRRPQGRVYAFGRNVRSYPGPRFIAALGGLSSAAAVTAQPGQTLNVPLTITNQGPATLYFAAHGWIWEASGTPGSLGTLAIPGIGTVPLGAHLTTAAGSPNAATGSANASGGTWTPTLQSEGALSYTGQPEGVWVHLHVYQDSAMTQEVSGSPVAAWTGSFLTVALPGISSLISFGIGSPSLS